MKVKVTEDHIVNGVPVDSERCMLVLAIANIVRNNVNVVVGTDDIHFHGKTGMRRWSLVLLQPSIAVERREAFDRCENIEPFEFELDIPCHLLKQQPVSISTSPQPSTTSEAKSVAV